MSPLGILVVLTAFPGPVSPEANPDATADLVVLRDGQEVRGQVVKRTPGGPVELLIRREWARWSVPEWVDRWEAAEPPVVRRATDQALQRLRAWKRERAAHPAGDVDRISSWIDRELVRLQAAPGERKTSPLMRVRLSPRDARSVQYVAAERTRLLQLAWLSGLPDPEGMTADALKEALEGRGYDTSSIAPVSLDVLLPPREETDRAWLIRRAATEVSYDADLRFLRTNGLVLPEPRPAGRRTWPTGSPQFPRSRTCWERIPSTADGPTPVGLGTRAGGALVTSLEIAPDASGVGVSIALGSAPGRPLDPHRIPDGQRPHRRLEPRRGERPRRRPAGRHGLSAR